jgi:hypothetical protein
VRPSESLPRAPLRPLPGERRGGFAAHLAAVQAQAPEAAPGDGMRQLLPPHLSGRVILVGPPGAGRRLLAARLAAAALRAPGSPRPVLVAPRPDLLTGPGPLAGWARLMGLALHRPVWADGLPVRLALPDPEGLEILDLSDMTPPAPEGLGPLAKLSDSQIWLVLPTGLHPALQARICPPWAGVARLIVLTRADLCPPTPEDHALHESFGIAPALLSEGAGLLDRLRLLEPLPPAAPPEARPDASPDARPAPEAGVHQAGVRNASAPPPDVTASRPLDDHSCEDASDAATHLS